MATNLFDIQNDRILPSPLNYTGAKFRLMPVLSKFIPSDVDDVYDLFCGGGSFFVNCFLGKRVYANDIIVPLIEFYVFLQKNEWSVVLDAIRSRAIAKNQAEYLVLRERFNKERDPVDFFLLCCSCTNNMMRFNQSFKFNQTWGDRIFNESTQRKLYDYHQRIYENDRFEFTHLNFEDVPVSGNSLVYLDPPYLITCAGYNCYWSPKLELALYNYLDYLTKRRIKFLMSNVSQHKGKANLPLDMLKKYDIVKIDYDYNKVSRSGSSVTQEIIVKNY